MEVKNRSLIITDPCYVAKEEDWGSNFDWETNEIDPSLGFSDYLWVPSGYGDGSPVVFEIDRDINLYKYFNEVSKARNNNDDESLDELYSLRNDIDGYCMDAGCMCVFYLDEVEKYYPEFFDEYADHCYSIIENFTGTVTDIEDEEGCYHFVLTPEDNSEPLIVTD